MKEFFHSRSFKILLAAMLLLLGVILYTASIGGFAPLTSSIVGGITTPLQDLTAQGTEAADELLNTVTDDPAVLKQQVQLLQEQLAQKNAQLNDYYSIKKENEQLRLYLDIKDEHNDWEFVPASVIGRDPNELFYGFTINKGSLAGVSLNDPVITNQGLVGKVTQVGATYAKVTTILDPSLNVGCFCSKTSDSGILSGELSLADQNQTRLTNLDPEATLSAGDLIVSSGLGGVFPKDLIIGEVLDISRNSHDISLSAIIKPVVDVREVQDVFIITSFLGQGETADEVDGEE